MVIAYGRRVHRLFWPTTRQDRLEYDDRCRELSRDKAEDGDVMDYDSVLDSESEHDDLDVAEATQSMELEEDSDTVANTAEAAEDFLQSFRKAHQQIAEVSTVSKVEIDSGVSHRIDTESILGSELKKKLALTDDLKEKMLSARGETPERPAWGPRDDADIDRYQTLLKEIIQAIPDLLLSSALARKLFNKPKAFYMVANGRSQEQQLLFELYSDPRIVPYEVQLLLGQESWDKQMFDRLTRLDALNLGQMDNVWGVYNIQVSITQENGTTLPVEYIGNSVAGYRGGKAGIPVRLKGHESLFAREEADVQKSHSESSSHPRIRHAS